MARFPPDRASTVVRPRQRSVVDVCSWPLFVFTGGGGGCSSTTSMFHFSSSAVVPIHQLGWMGDSGFGSNVVLKLTGVSYRQLDYWARTGLVGSSIRQAKGHGSRRVYSFQDLVALRVVARLLDAVVIAIDVEPIVKDLRADVTELSAAREIDECCTRDRRASAGPRLPGGAHTGSRGRRLHGRGAGAARLHYGGDTLPEARRMAREAVEAWLDAAAPQHARRDVRRPGGL